MPTTGTLTAIKSIQRGTVTISNGQNSGTSTINSVDTSKSILRHLGCSSGTNVNIRIALTNSTTVTANQDDGSSGNRITSFEVVEYE